MHYLPKTSRLALFLLPLVIFINYLLKDKNHPLAKLNTKEFIDFYGYPSELHNVTTADGYILTLHRIPHGRRKIKEARLGPVLVTHGIMQSSAEYVCFGPEKALGLILADAGYDVWLENSRTTTWSRKHVKFDPDKDFDYWNYTVHEMSIYDIPANIDYILSKTNNSQLQYIGFSQGTSKAVISLSELPEYNKKIKLLSLMAPAIIVKDVTNPLTRFGAKYANTLKVIFDLFGITELFPANGLLSYYLKFICNKDSIVIYLCFNVFDTIQGGSNQLDTDTLPAFIANLPAGVGTKQFIHSLQVGHGSTLCKYDYGNEKNSLIYNDKNPMYYNFSQVSAPIAFYYSKSDQIFNYKKNIDTLNVVFPNVVRNYLVPIDNFYHMDFIIGKSAPEYVFKEILNEMQKYN